MRYLFYLVLLIEALSFFWTIIKYNVFLEKKKKSKKTLIENQDLKYKINIIIPVLREQFVIENTINHFLSIIDKDNTTIYIVTTEKEIKEKTDEIANINLMVSDILNDSSFNYIVSKYNKLLPTPKLKRIYELKDKYQDKEIEFAIKIREIVNSFPTTYEYLNSLDIITNNKNIKVINYPKTDGIMADQLNFAIDTILEDSEITDINKIYCSIYNADSIPNENTFNEVKEKIIKNNYPEVIQQYSLNLSNYEKLSFLMKGFSIYQSAFEIRNGFLNSISKNLYSHVVGHGLTIRLDTILDADKFNTTFWCEDIYLTGALINKKINIIPLNTLESSETPESLLLQIKQSGNWFKTASQHLKILKDIKKKQKISFNGILWLLSEFRATLMWILFPFFILFSLVYPLLIQNSELFILSIILYLIFAFINYFYIVHNFSNKKLGITSYFSTCIALMLTNLGPIYSFFAKEKHKTPR